MAESGNTHLKAHHGDENACGIRNRLLDVTDALELATRQQKLVRNTVRADFDIYLYLWFP